MQKSGANVRNGSKPVIGQVARMITLGVVDAVRRVAKHKVVVLQRCPPLMSTVSPGSAFRSILPLNSCSTRLLSGNSTRMRRRQLAGHPQWHDSAPALADAQYQSVIQSTNHPPSLLCSVEIAGAAVFGSQPAEIRKCASRRSQYLLLPLCLCGEILLFAFRSADENPSRPRTARSTPSGSPAASRAARWRSVA